MFYVVPEILKLHHTVTVTQTKSNGGEWSHDRPVASLRS